MVAVTKQQFDAICEVIRNTYERQRIRPCDVAKVEEFREHVERLCQRSLRCCVEVFGSTKNGFGTKDSDVDLCLHLDPYSLETFRFVQHHHQTMLMPSLPYSSTILLGLTYDLYRRWSFTQLTAILTARVPVLKLSCGSQFAGIQADLTLCNEVAIQNTRLLRSYGNLDARVPQLGVALKVWTKCCNISGASEGWLSSYAYIIMLIYFLQRTERPVLPFLQQVSLPMKPKKPMMIGGWDVYFYDPDEMVWLAPNSQSLGELWLEFFAFYAWKFDFENEVVQIRHPRALPKKRKMWECSAFAIEDPFVLSHNLAATVDAEALLHIKETFALTYYHFASGHCLQCSDELDITHAESLYRKCDLAPRRVDPVLECSAQQEHSVETCSKLSAIAQERLTPDSDLMSIDKGESISSCSVADTNFSNDSGLFSLGSDSETIFSEESRSTSNSDETPNDEQEAFELTSDCGETIDEGYEGSEPLSLRDTSFAGGIKIGEDRFDSGSTCSITRSSSSGAVCDGIGSILLPYRTQAGIDEASLARKTTAKCGSEIASLTSSLDGLVVVDGSHYRRTPSCNALDSRAELVLFQEPKIGRTASFNEKREDYNGMRLLPSVISRIFFSVSQQRWISRILLYFFPPPFMGWFLASIFGILHRLG